MAEDILTRAVAKGRADTISKVHYSLELGFQQKAKTYSGKCEVIFTFKKTGEPLRLDFIGSVKQVKVNGVKTDFKKEEYHILIPDKFLEDGQNAVEIEYENEYNHSGDGLHQFVDPEDGREYVYSNFEPYDAHRMFPCFDQPDLKATYSLVVTAPSDWVVISNTGESKFVDKSGTKTWTFKKTHLFSTYLFHVSAGNFVGFHTKHNGMDLRIFCRQSMKKHVREKEIFLLTGQGLDFYSKFFDYPYPFEKYDQIFVPEFNSGAMENVAAITFSEHYLFRHEPTRTERSRLANVILHEMVHMWFGDLVTMKWWDDLWLNESFADFLSYFGMANATEFVDAWQLFYARKAWAYYQDQLVTTHPIAADAPDTEIAFTNFDGISYSKGAAVLKQLLYFLGEDVFKKGLGLYFKKHQWRNTVLKDFLDAMTEASGIDLTDWSRIWLETTGVNSIEAVYEADNAGSIKSFSLKQNQSTGSNIFRPHKVQLGLFYENEASCEKGKEQSVFYQEPLTQVSNLVGTKKPDLIYLNCNDHDYVKDIFDEGSLKYALNNLEKIKENLTRQMVIGSLWQMVRDAKLDPEKYLNLVFTKSPKESTLIILERMFITAAHILGYYIKDEKYAQWCEKFYQLGWENIKKDGVPKENKNAWFLMILAGVGGAKSADNIVDLLKGSLVVKNFEYNQEHRWDTIVRLAGLGHPETDGLIKKELERDPTDIGKKSAFEAEVAKIENKEKSWKMFVDGTGHSLDYLRTGMGGFYSKKQKEKLRAYIDLFFANIEKVFEKQERTYAKAFFGSLFPSLFVEKTLVEKGEALLKKDLHQVLKKDLLEALDETKRSLKILETF
ncbi:MAG TPA: aminopeptidase N [archaeon]|nr:aminopeptidase N [archaeon]